METKKPGSEDIFGFPLPGLNDHIPLPGNRLHYTVGFRNSNDLYAILP